MAEMQAYKTADDCRQWAAYKNKSMVRHDLQDHTSMKREKHKKRETQEMTRTWENSLRQNRQNQMEHR
jgi:hypothetical protein